MECFVALGGNFENTFAAFRRSIALLSHLAGVKAIKTSRIFRTTPLSDLTQPDYLNAVCRFDCTLTVKELWKALKGIEMQIGKSPKPKNAPRMIDLDMLFFGNIHLHTEELTIPHPEWSNRLFVLVPLLELLEDHSFPHPSILTKLLSHFSNNKEKVVPISEPHPFQEILSCHQ